MIVMMINATWINPSCAAIGTPILSTCPIVTRSSRKSALFTEIPVFFSKSPKSDTATLIVCESVVPKCRSRWSHMKCSDKQVIQRNICYAGNRNKIHRTLRIPKSPENRCDHVIRGDKQDSYKTDRKIPHRSFYRFPPVWTSHARLAAPEPVKRLLEPLRRPTKSTVVFPTTFDAFGCPRSTARPIFTRGSHRQTDDHHCQHMPSPDCRWIPPSCSQRHQTADNKQIRQTI